MLDLLPICFVARQLCISFQYTPSSLCSGRNNLLRNAFPPNRIVPAKIPSEKSESDKDKPTKASVTARWRQIRFDPTKGEEREIVVRYLGQCEKEAGASSAVEEAQKTVLERARAKYSHLTEAGITTLVVGDQSLATLATTLGGELNRDSQTLTGRINELAERNAAPLQQLTDEVAVLAAKADGHLKRMGFSY